VIKDADEVHITLHDNRTFEAKIIGVDPSTDLALLKIDVSDLTFIPFANSDEVKVGQWVLAVGNPFNLNSTVTAGIVSAKGRNINILKDKYAIESFIQTDAAINPGNSGGALVNLNGELIGINTAIASPTGSYSGYGFAIPSNITKKVIGDLLEFGTVQRAFLGVSIRDVDANLAKEKGLQQTEGIYVESMQANSAARQAGIENGDVIIIADNVKVKTIPELQEIIAKHAPGDKITITVMRGNEEKSFDVILSTAHGVTQSIAKTDSDVLSRLGISITSVQPEILKKLGIAGGVRITHITNGVISNATDMKPGCIIVKVDRQQVLSNQQFIDIIKSKEGGILLECRYENQRATYYYGFGL
jgi:S1-C subfamily serine protease